MKSDKCHSLDIAVRVYPVLPDARKREKQHKRHSRPDSMFVIDCETTADETQRLTFGSYRLYEKGRCTREALFYADDLSERYLKVLQRYVERHRAETEGCDNDKLELLTVAELVEQFYDDVYFGRCLLVGFNLPFDLSRIASDSTKARGRFAGGFSLVLSKYADGEHVKMEDKYRPRIGIKHIDSKRALKGFTACREPEEHALIPEGSEDGEPQVGYKFRGHFLDLRTLAFALTDRSYSLESACVDFGVEHGKQKITRHGIVTEKYIDYNRRDVLATEELAVKLLAEFDKHPISLQATKSYSPASVGKAYLKAMGIRPILERQPDFPTKFLGYAAAAFYGGRTSAHIRKSPIPVVYVDFLSMYPTVNSLMGLWQFVIAGEIRVEENCRDEIIDFLSSVTVESLFRQSTWKTFPAFVKAIPDGDILPIRAKYGHTSNDWQVGVNHVYARSENDALWYALPDVVASVILTGQVPKIIDAFRIVPHGTQADLKPTKLYGQISVDPARNDFFRVAIEERKKLSTRKDLTPVEKARLDKALKVLANASSYGIYAEMYRQESEEAVPVTCYGIDPKPFSCRVAHPDVPGEYCFPPLASLITSAARLMLALLERCVLDLGGTYAMEDTDSMTIVATKRGGLVPCPGGTTQIKNGACGVQALSWKQVDEISQRFEALNPYDRKAVPGSVLKIEDDNRDPRTKAQRQLYCLAISAKRYALFLLHKNGEPLMLKQGVNNKNDRWSQHGLGHLLNPTDPETDDRNWIGQAWTNIIRKALGLRTSKVKFGNEPAVGRVSVSSPAVMRAFVGFNEGKQYADQIKPFNFVLTCQVRALGHPTGERPDKFHLTAPYNPDSRAWLKRPWINQYTGESFHITTEGQHGERKTARVKTYSEILSEYELHPESKCADADGNPCGKQTVGLLQRRHVEIARVRCIGKESNALEDVEAGLVHSTDSVYTEYCDRNRDEWQTKWLPALRSAQLEKLLNLTGFSRRMVLYARRGKRRPHAKNRSLLIAALQKLTKPA